MILLWKTSVNIQIKASEQLTFEFVDEILKCNHSNESYWAVLSCGTVYYAVRGGFNFWVCGWNPKMWPFEWKLLSSTYLWYCFLIKYVVQDVSTTFWVCGSKLLRGTFLWCCLLDIKRFSWLHKVFLLFEGFNNKDLRFILRYISQHEIASFS